MATQRLPFVRHSPAAPPAAGGKTKTADKTAAIKAAAAENEKAKTGTVEPVGETTPPTAAEVKAAKTAKAAADKEAAAAAKKAIVKVEKPTIPEVILPATFEARVLSDDEKAERDAIETRMAASKDGIVRNMNKFMADAEVIRTKGLYADYGGGFPAYMAEKWGVSLSQFFRLQSFDNRIKQLVTYKQETGDSFPLPDKETANRQLSRLGSKTEPAEIAKVMTEAQEVAKARGSNKVTEQDIKAIVDKRLGYTGATSNGVVHSEVSGGGNAVELGENPDSIDPNAATVGDLETETVLVTVDHFRQWAEAWVDTDPADTNSPRHHYLMEMTRSPRGGVLRTLTIDNTPDIEADDLATILARCNEFAGKALAAWRDLGHELTAAEDQQAGSDLSDDVDEDEDANTAPLDSEEDEGQGDDGDAEGE